MSPDSIPQISLGTAALVIFLGSWWALAGSYGNHGLWAALLIFYVARAVTLLPFHGSVRRAALRAQ